MRIGIQHRTCHRYEGPVSFGDHALYLRPLASHRRRIERFEVRTEPESRQRWVRDVYGNTLLVCNFGLNEAEALKFDVRIELELEEDNPFDFILEPYASAYPFDYDEHDRRALEPCLDRAARPGALRVLDWFYGAVSQPVQHPNSVQFLSDLNEAIRRDVHYVERPEEGIQNPDTTLSERSGSCRDMAVLFIAAARQLGLAARFVSGYLYDPPIGEKGQHAFNRAVGSMHAWAEVYLPGAGWKGFDPTNGILANSFFIPTAVSRDPKAVDPIQGKYFSKSPTRSELDFELSIESLDGANG